MNEETEKSKSVARRKITEHEEPLYFRVMKETFLEYEKQMEFDENEGRFKCENTLTKTFSSVISVLHVQKYVKKTVRKKV